MEPKISNCRGCDAPIIWTITENGKRMPLDADPTEDGKFVIADPPEGESNPLGVWFTKAQQYGVGGAERHKAHWATCPKSVNFKGKK